MGAIGRNLLGGILGFSFGALGAAIDNTLDRPGSKLGHYTKGPLLKSGGGEAIASGGVVAMGDILEAIYLEPSLEMLYDDPALFAGVWGGYYMFRRYGGNPSSIQRKLRAWGGFRSPESVVINDMIREMKAGKIERWDTIVQMIKDGHARDIRPSKVIESLEAGLEMRMKDLEASPSATANMEEELKASRALLDSIRSYRASGSKYTVKFRAHEVTVDSSKQPRWDEVEHE